MIGVGSGNPLKVLPRPKHHVQEDPTDTQTSEVLVTLPRQLKFALRATRQRVVASMAAGMLSCPVCQQLVRAFSISHEPGHINDISGHGQPG